jgi:PilZ domain
MTFKNKRKHQRIPSLNLTYVCLDEKDNIVKQGMGRTLNISESGILLETHFSIEPEYMVLLSIALKEDLLEIKGKPIHAKSNETGEFEVGIEFLDPDQESIRLLENFISRDEPRNTSTGKRDA